MENPLSNRYFLSFSPIPFPLSDIGWSSNTDHDSDPLKFSIDQGHRVIALVALDGNNHFSTCEDDAENGHWIRIRSISNEEVSYYDSLSNNEKTVSRQAFEQAWESAQYVDGNSVVSANLFVEAYRK